MASWPHRAPHSYSVGPLWFTDWEKLRCGQGQPEHGAAGGPLTYVQGRCRGPVGEADAGALGRWARGWGWPRAATATVTSSRTEGQGQSGMPAGHLQPPAIHTVLSSKSFSIWDSLAFTVTSGCLCGFSSFQRSPLRPLGLPWSSNCNWKHPPPKTEQRYMLHRDSCV